MHANYLIEIFHEFYGQSVIVLCTVSLKFILMIYIIELNKIVSHCGNIYETSISFKKKMKWFRDKHKLYAVSSNMANSGLIDTKIRGKGIDIITFLQKV